MSGAMSFQKGEEINHCNDSTVIQPFILFLFCNIKNFTNLAADFEVVFQNVSRGNVDDLGLGDSINVSFDSDQSLHLGTSGHETCAKITCQQLMLLPPSIPSFLFHYVQTEHYFKERRRQKF